MEMGTDTRIGSIGHEGEIYTCPVCGYTDGWHVSFKFSKVGLSPEIYLICPTCHSRFRTGWTAQMKGEER